MSASTSRLDLAAIRARAEEAERIAPGPWEWYGHPFQDITGDGLETFYSVWLSRTDRPQLVAKGDSVEPLLGKRGTMIFVAAAITDVPALCDEVERLQTALADMERTNQQLAALVSAKNAELIKPDAAGPRPGELGCPCGHPERLHSYSEDGRKVCRAVGCGCGWDFAKVLPEPTI